MCSLVVSSYRAVCIIVSRHSSGIGEHIFISAVVQRGCNVKTVSRNMNEKRVVHAHCHQIDLKSETMTQGMQSLLVLEISLLTLCTSRGYKTTWAWAMDSLFFAPEGVWNSGWTKCSGHARELARNFSFHLFSFCLACIIGRNGPERCRVIALPWKIWPHPTICVAS